MTKNKLWKGDKKTVVVIIHGWTANTEQVNPLAEDLNKLGYPVCAPLLKGHGTKPEDLERVKWSEWLLDVENAISEVKKYFPDKKIHLVGISLGGNLALLASLDKKIDGVTLLGTPIYLQNHYWTFFLMKLAGIFKKYIHKKYPGSVSKAKKVSYSYFPVKSAQESIKLIKKTGRQLGSVRVPVLIIQTNNDYMVASYSPWIVYNRIGSKIKKLHWIQVEKETHISLDENTSDYTSAINNFIKESQQ
ncbi:MAG: alpha/beta hydrolase [Patescibacteria group bacterium]